MSGNPGTCIELPVIGQHLARTFGLIAQSRELVQFMAARASQSRGMFSCMKRSR